MQAQTGVVQCLNAVLSSDLIVINQTFLHARMFRNWGLGGLNDAAYKESIRAMKRVDRLMERILFLEGVPNLQHLGRLRIGEACQEMLQCDLDLMRDGIEESVRAIELCEEAQDYVSRSLLEAHLSEQEDYFDWVETQQELIDKMGIANYLQAQA